VRTNEFDSRPRRKRQITPGTILKILKYCWVEKSNFRPNHPRRSVLRLVDARRQRHCEIQINYSCWECSATLQGQFVQWSCEWLRVGHDSTEWVGKKLAFIESSLF
jgi:hypothetical protein